ncbi:hypothetical protein B0H14DRAFT_2902412, partial [Mycena olivaceomarginata]
MLEYSFAASHSAANLYRCGDCQKTFSSNAGLNQHTRTVHTLAAVSLGNPLQRRPPSRVTAKLHPCGKCQRTFRRKESARDTQNSPPPTQATRPVSKTQENPRSAPPRKRRAGAAQRRDARLETMQTKPIAAYPTQCAVCDRLVPSPHWIPHREADVTLKRRMRGLSRGRVQVDRLALNFGAAAGTQTLKVTNVGRSAVYFSPWIRSKLFVLIGGSEKRMLKPSTSKQIEVKLSRLRTRLDITFQLPGQEGRATVTRLISVEQDLSMLLL